MIEATTRARHISVSGVQQLGVSYDDERLRFGMVGQCEDGATFVFELGDVEALRQVHSAISKALEELGAAVVIAGPDAIARLDAVQRRQPR